MRQIKINSTIGNEIVTTAEAKDFIRVETSADDNLISIMITTARIYCENYISRDIVSKNRSYYLDYTDSGIFDLPFGPVSEISTITSDGSALTYDVRGLDNETIELDGGSAEKVIVVYITTGLSDNLLKQAILQTVATYYDNRADFVKGESLNVLPTNAKSILNSYKNMFV